MLTLSNTGTLERDLQRPQDRRLLGTALGSNGREPKLEIGHQDPGL
jgi:hypothetical protein